MLNIGTNRWAYKPELGVAKNRDKWTLEIAASASFFTGNDDYFGGNTLEKDPLFALQAHVIRSLGRGAWAGIDATYYDSGRTTVNGVRNDDRESSSRVGLTVALPLSMHQSLKFYASTGTTTRAGGDFTTVGLVWQYRWGAGLPPSLPDSNRTNS